LQTTLYQYLSGVGDGSKVDRNGRRSGRPRPPPKLLLKWRHWLHSTLSTWHSLIIR